MTKQEITNMLFKVIDELIDEAEKDYLTADACYGLEVQAIVARDEAWERLTKYKSLRRKLRKEKRYCKV